MRDICDAAHILYSQKFISFLTEISKSRVIGFTPEEILVSSHSQVGRQVAVICTHDLCIPLIFKDIALRLGVVPLTSGIILRKVREKTEFVHIIKTSTVASFVTCREQTATATYITTQNP